MEHMYWNRPVETMPQDELRQLQTERLKTTVSRVYQNVPFYRDAMQKKGVSPADIKTLDDIRHLPFTDKPDLRDHYPDELFAASKDDIVRVHASSGTTGKPIVAGYTSRDIDVWSEVCARSLTCANTCKNSVVQVSYGYGLFTGGLGAHYGAERIGATVIPMSGGNTQRQIMLMQDLGSTALACTPSYALLIGETLAEMGVDPASLKLRYGIFGAEPWTEGMRERIEKLLNIKALDIYGLTEVIGPGVAMECLCKNGLHVWEDHFIPEIVDPKTGEPLPDGQHGELCFTTITKEGMPLLRYRTHDITYIMPETCACGRTHRRISKLTGRTDDMLIIRGVNVFPSQIEEVLVSAEGALPHYLLVVDRVKNLDTLEVWVEVSETYFSDEVRKLEALEKSLTQRIASVLNVSAKIKLVSPHSIERSEGKAKRVLDKRKL